MRSPSSAASAEAARKYAQVAAQPPSAHPRPPVKPLVPQLCPPTSPDVRATIFPHTTATFPHPLVPQLRPTCVRDGLDKETIVIYVGGGGRWWSCRRRAGTRYRSCCPLRFTREGGSAISALSGMRKPDFHSPRGAARPTTNTALQPHRWACNEPLLLAGCGPRARGLQKTATGSLAGHPPRARCQPTYRIQSYLVRWHFPNRRATGEPPSNKQSARQPRSLHGPTYVH